MAKNSAVRPFWSFRFGVGIVDGVVVICGKGVGYGVVVIRVEGIAVDAGTCGDVDVSELVPGETEGETAVSRVDVSELVLRSLGTAKRKRIKTERKKSTEKKTALGKRFEADIPGADTFRRSVPIPLFLFTKIPDPISLRP